MGEMRFGVCVCVGGVSPLITGIRAFPKIGDPNIVPEIVGSLLSGSQNKVPRIVGNSHIGALILTYTMLGVPYYSYSIMGPKALF